MTCEQMRVALSARLDREPPGLPAATLDGHLASCPGCAAWLAQAERLTRAVRRHQAQPPDLTAAVLAAASADAEARRRRRGLEAHTRRQVLRLALAGAALVQLMLALPVLLGGAAAVGAHSGREMASFEVAVAVGFALVAWRPQHARALVPMALVLAACLAVTTVIDLAGGGIVLRHEAGHLAAVVQAGLLWALGRAGTPGRESHAGRAVSA